jgi:hypothetical protein
MRPQLDPKVAFVFRRELNVKRERAAGAGGSSVSGRFACWLLRLGLRPADSLLHAAAWSSSRRVKTRYHQHSESRQNRNAILLQRARCLNRRPVRESCFGGRVPSLVCDGSHSNTSTCAWDRGAPPCLLFFGEIGWDPDAHFHERSLRTRADLTELHLSPERFSKASIFGFFGQTPRRLIHPNC